MDIGGTSLRVALVCGDQVLARRSFLTNGGEAWEPAVARLTATALEFAERVPVADTVAIASPGLLDDGRIVLAGNLPSWQDVPIRDVFERQLGRRAVLVEDCAAMAVGERVAGGHPDGGLFVVGLGTGVATAAVIDGVVIPGWGGLLLTVDAKGGLSYLETKLGARALRGRLDEAVLQPDAGSLRALVEAHGPRPEVVAWAAHRGDPVACEIWDDMGRELGWAAVNAAHLLAARTVAVTGGLSRAGRLLLDPATRFFEANISPPLRSWCTLAPSRLGGNATLIGAAALAAGLAA